MFIQENFFLVIIRILIYFIIAFIISSFLTWLIQCYTISHSILDIPNERSSHSTPIPRGGGLAIVLTTSTGLGLIWFLFRIWPWSNLLLYLAGGLLIAIISWIDDLHPVPWFARFISHSLAAIIILAGFGFWKSIIFPGLGKLDLGWAGLPITFLWIVGLTNSYNFMDGIDGIAGSQAFVAGLGWAFLGILFELPLVAALGTLLSATSLGFLSFNWPPASIFMGDVGSAFLGYTFASLGIISSKKEPSLAIAGFLLVWPFVFDTSFTFFRRVINKENVFAPHRSHLYQRLVISGFNHRTVTLVYIGLDILGLLLALMTLAKKTWMNVMIIIVLSLACFGLLWFTVNSEKNKMQNSVVWQ